MEIQLLTTDISRIRKAQLKEILLKHNIRTVGETTASIRKKASILKQSLTLAQTEPSLSDFIKGVLNQTHVLDTQQILQFPILAELEKLVLYDTAGRNLEETTYESLSATDSDNDSVSGIVTLNNPTPSAIGTIFPANTEKQQPHPHQHPPVVHKIATMTENLPLVSAGTFSGLNSENAADFVDKYLLAADSNNWSDQSKLKLFPSHLGGIAINWYKNYKAKTLNQAIPTWESLKTEFLQAFTPLAQCSSLSAILENKLQGPNETTLSYLLDITTTCRRYDPTITETQIISYILRGLRPEILQQVLTKQNDTLDRLEKNLKEAELFCITVKQNLALYTKQPTPTSSFSHNPDSNEFVKLQQQVQVLTDLVANVLPPKPDEKRWSNRQNPSRGNKQQPNYRSYHLTPQNYPQERNRFRTQQPTSITKQQAPIFKFCDFCKTNSHVTENCWFRFQRQDHPLNNHPIVCKYCKQPGHIIQQCTKSRFFNPQYLKNQHPTPTTPNNTSGNGLTGGSANTMATPRS